jgi:methylated-DNA-protein-cysteine methyltransferase-like protein
VGTRRTLRSDEARELARVRIRATVDAIPPGRVASYGQVAREAGLPGRARLVGRVLADLDAGSALPWHRVVDAAGRIPPRPGGSAARQRRLLAAEGVAFDARGRVRLARHAWRSEEGDEGP